MDSGDKHRRHDDVVSFGPFRLFAASRLLEKDGDSIPVGSRALDILITLAERPGEVVTKKELLEQVWKGLRVEETSLRFHVAALRKALGDGRAGGRYIVNIPARGYCLAAPVSRMAVPEGLDRRLDPDLLPRKLVRMVGREDAVQAISRLLTTQRFVTVVGPGGIGKTTVAVAVCHELKKDFADAIYFCDLGMVQDAEQVDSSIASTLGLTVSSDEVVSALIAFLRDRRVILALDSCEHVIDSIAETARRISSDAPLVHILATSRESLRVDGEHVYRLAPLACPPDDADLTAEQAVSFSAVQHFVERVRASGHEWLLSDADAPTVSRICRRLDGIALALELAASRVGVFGIIGTAAQLESQFRLLWRGQRTALPRHQTLSATLDWSYNLLTDLEKAVLRRLSVFAGSFSLEAAESVSALPDIEAPQVSETIVLLVAKSLVVSTDEGATAQYRLLDTARAYLIQKLKDPSERNALARRHADYYFELLSPGDAECATLSRLEALALYGQHLANVRAALEWCFSQDGDTQLGILLAARAEKLFLGLSLLAEGRTWAQRALAALGPDVRGTHAELTLQSSLGLSLMFTQGNQHETHAALSQALKLAANLGDPQRQLQVLGTLNMYCHRSGNFEKALTFAHRGEGIAKATNDATAAAVASCMLCISDHLLGSQADAQARYESVMSDPAFCGSAHGTPFGREHRIRALTAFARALWLTGHADRAVELAQYAIADADRFGHAVYSCLCRSYAVSVFLWSGDFALAESTVDRLIGQAEKHSLLPYRLDGLGLKGELAVKRGDTQAGTELLGAWFARPAPNRSQILASQFAAGLAEALVAQRQFEAASAVISRNIEEAERLGRWFYLPELWRIKGEILSASPGPDNPRAEESFKRALEFARQQSAVAWELRITTSMARLLRACGNVRKARDVLAPVYSRFTEGLNTHDLREARELLKECPTERASRGGASRRH